MYNINFTMSQDQSAITFLDLEIYKSSRFNQHGILDIKLLKKKKKTLRTSSTMTSLATHRTPSTPLSKGSFSGHSAHLPMPKPTQTLFRICSPDFKREAIRNKYSWKLLLPSTTETEHSTYNQDPRESYKKTLQSSQ